MSNLINREDALHAIGTEIVGVTNEGRQLLDMCQFAIKQLPSIDTEKNNLKQCPFCGGLAQTEVQIMSVGGDSDRIAFSVVCDKCGTTKTVSLYLRKKCNFLDVEKAMSEAIKKWNMRAENE